MDALLVKLWKANRPGFQSMLDDIDLGYVTTVMVKDLSRLGRDYVSVGHYTDNYFPDRNVRFIAVNDMVDSDEGKNEIAPFKNIMNEMYARDISRKVRSAHRIRGNLGEPLSQPPYGYIKSPDDKKRWIIEPEAAAVSELGSMQQGRDSFLQAIRRFMEMGTLTAPLLQELIDHIDVYETEGKGKHRTQRVVIYYRFVGYIDLSEADFEDALLQQENHRVDTRQGVAVEYLPEKPRPEHRPAEAIA